MKAISQKAEFGCGPACVAMLCDRPLIEVLKVFRHRDWSEEGVNEDELRAAFSAFGYTMGEAMKISGSRDALIDKSEDLLLWGPILNRHKVAAWDDVSHRTKFSFNALALHKVVVRGHDNTEISIDTFDHWAVWDGSARALRDPYGYQSMFVPVWYHRISKS